MAKMELSELDTQREEIEEKVKFLLIPKDPEDAKNAIIEIRAGTGGDEASIFAGDLLLKNFGVTRHGRVIFYDYDEIEFIKAEYYMRQGQTANAQAAYEPGIASSMMGFISS